MVNKKQEQTVIDNASFLDKNGKHVNVINVIDKTKDCWMLKGQHGREIWILSHKAVEKLASIAGISKNYDVEESAHIIPDLKNEHEHIVRVTIHCKAKPEEQMPGCIHSDDNWLTITGEANRVNTPNRGSGYLRKMAEKRAFDIAVLKHLDLYTAIFSEEESEDFQHTDRKESRIMPGTKEFEMIVEDVNVILNAVDKKLLKEAGNKIKKSIKENKYNDAQLIYLRELFQRQSGKLNSQF